MTESVTVERITGSLGAEIHSLDLGSISDDSTYVWLNEQLVEHKVLFFRNQNLSSDQQIAFGEHFGKVLDVHPWSHSKNGYRRVMVIKNAAASGWHSDESWRNETPMASVLYCRRAPRYGGDTVFADMEKAFADLPQGTQEKLAKLSAVHDHISHRRRMIRLGVAEEKIEAWRRQYPAIEHPVVRTHPVSGRKSLYVSGGFTARIVGMAEDESSELLRHIYKLADNPAYQCRFRWRENSIAFWDNRSVQHYGVPDFGEQERLMERVTIAGTKPN